MPYDEQAMRRKKIEELRFLGAQDPQTAMAMMNDLHELAMDEGEIEFCRGWLNGLDAIVQVMRVLAEDDSDPVTLDWLEQLEEQTRDLRTTFLTKIMIDRRAQRGKGWPPEWAADVLREE